MATKNAVIVQKWEQAERGEGAFPLGYSLHLTEAHRKAFIRDYRKTLPDYAPDVYDRCDGNPYTAQVNKEIFNEVKASKNGTRRFKNDPPQPRKA